MHALPLAEPAPPAEVPELAALADTAGRQRPLTATELARGGADA
jgi:hypothetical protein